MMLHVRIIIICLSVIVVLNPSFSFGNSSFFLNLLAQFSIYFFPKFSGYCRLICFFFFCPGLRIAFLNPMAFIYFLNPL